MTTVENSVRGKRRLGITVGLSLGALVGVVGCGEMADAGADEGEREFGLASLNGLVSINGLSSTNGLSSINGLSSTNGLASINGLSSTNGLITTSAGRSTIAYLVKCAVPAGHNIVKNYNGTNYTFGGGLGLAPSWEFGAANQDELHWVSSCLMAHVNTTGQPIAVWLDGQAPVGWGRSPSYPVQEGTFIGNLFTSPPIARYCGGRGYGSNVVKGRIGDDSQVSKPYSVMTSGTGSTRCDNICSRDASGDGYVDCSPIAGKALTVWRQMVGTPTYSFETGVSPFYGADGHAYKPSLLVSGAQALHSGNSMLAMFSTGGAGTAKVENASAPIKPGKNMTVFVKIPTGAWSYVDAFVQDGPAKNYRYTSRGYNADQVIPGEWNSIVVPVPSDFALTGARMGVSIHASAATTIKLYIDAVFFEG
jgi:hypothetical protein